MFSSVNQARVVVQGRVLRQPGDGPRRNSPWVLKDPSSIQTKGSRVAATASISTGIDQALSPMRGVSPAGL